MKSLIAIATLGAAVLIGAPAQADVTAADIHTFAYSVSAQSEPCSDMGEALQTVVQYQDADPRTVNSIWYARLATSAAECEIVVKGERPALGRVPEAFRARACQWLTKWSGKMLPAAWACGWSMPGVSPRIAYQARMSR